VGATLPIVLGTDSRLNLSQTLFSTLNSKSLNSRLLELKHLVLAMMSL
jgi:hypothetical protein